MALYSTPINSSSGKIFHDEPDVITLRDALYVPVTRHLDHSYGVFSRDGLLINQCAFFWQNPLESKGQPVISNIKNANCTNIIDSAVYTGFINYQYGHFITEFLSRVWCLKEIRNGRPILLHSDISIDNIFSCSWLRDFLGLLDLEKKDFIIPSEPSVIRELTIPFPSFGEDNHCSSVFARFCNEIGDKAYEKSSLKMKKENIYLSRSKLMCGTIKLDNEAAFEEKLSKKNVKIIHPQNLSLFDQISLYRDENIVSGILGSSFHTSIFTNSPQGIAINLKGKPSLNFLLMDRVNKSRIEYYNISDIRNSDFPDHNYLETKTLGDVDSVSESILDLFCVQRNSTSIPNMGFYPKNIGMNINFYSMTTIHGTEVHCDPRSGYLKSCSDKKYKKAYLVELKIRDDKSVYFISADSDNILPLRVRYDDVHNAIMPVELVKNGPYFGIKVQGSQNFICFQNQQSGGNVDATADSFQEWESLTLNLVGKTPYKNGSDTFEYISIIYLLIIGRYSFVLSRYHEEKKELFSAALRIKDRLVADGNFSLTLTHME